MAIEDLAQKVMGHAIDQSSFSDGRVWAIRIKASSVAATPLSQGSAVVTDTVFRPIIKEINEFEAEQIGQNAREGDLKLVARGNLTINDSVQLVCDDIPVDIFQTIPFYQNGVVQHYEIYVKRPPEKT